VPQRSRSSRGPLAFRLIDPRTGTPKWPPRVDASILAALRLTAAVATALALVATWHLFMRLPWYADGLIAVAACFAFAYRFERGEHT
jgi:hypothetical protein